MHQKDVAAQFGLGSQNAITRLERGDFTGLTAPVLRGITNFAQQQGASAEWLLTGKDPLEAASRGQLLRALGSRYAEELAREYTLKLARPTTGKIPLAGAKAARPAGRAVRLYDPGYEQIHREQRPARWRGSYVPIIGRLAAGEGADTSEAEAFEAGEADAYLIYTGAARDAFAVRIVGDSMEPDYSDGDMIVVDPGRPATSGDCCVIYVADGGERTARLKRLSVRGQWATLSSLNKKYPPIKVAAAHILAFEVAAHLPWIVHAESGRPRKG
jgi:SOS-response transcriptional repressor LexA